MPAFINTIRIPLSCAVLLGACAAHSASIFTTGNFNEVINTTEYFTPGSTGGSLHLVGSTVTGLQQFNPSLGTLTGVIVSGTFSIVDYSEIQAGEINDSGIAHSAKFTLGGADPAVVVSYHVTSNSTNSLAYTLSSVPALEASCSAEAGESSCTGVSAGDNYNFADRIAIPGDTLNKIGLGNLQGTGALLGFSVDSVHDYSSAFTTTNLVPEEEGTYAFLRTTISAGTVTLEYQYTPAVVPLPAAAWLFGSAVFGLVGLARRKRA